MLPALTCVPGHLSYPSAAVAVNAATLHTLAYPHCEGFDSWECGTGGHWHVGHTTAGTGYRCKANREHRATRKRIEAAVGRRR